MSTTLTFTNTLADNARQQLEPWLEEAASLARSLCSEHDFSGALTLVATDTVWAQYPDIRARITWAFPAPIDPAATAAVVMLYKQATDRHMAYSVATTRLATALVDSVGVRYLKTVFAGIALYALLPRQVIDAMITKHGVFTGDDINRLRAPLSSPLLSLSGLVSHQEKYLLASQRLTRSGQGETPFKYFEMFLDTVKGFPLVLQSMTPYWYPNPDPRDTLPISGRDAPVFAPERPRITVHGRFCHQAQHPAPAKSPQPSSYPWPQPAHCTLLLRQV